MTVEERIKASDIWDVRELGYWAVIPVNTCTRRDRTAVMGAGLAKQAAERFPDLPYLFGRELLEDESAGCRPHIFRAERLILLKTKHDWRKPAVPSLITCGLRWLASREWSRENLAFPLLGAGFGRLDSDASLALIVPYLAACPGWVVCLPPEAPQ